MSVDYIQRWNHDAGAVNTQLHKLSIEVAWVRVIEQPEFHTLFGANRQLLSKDGLHLSYEGTETLTSSIESAVQAIPVTSQTSEKSTVPTTPSLQEPVTVSGPRLFSEEARQPPPVPETLTSSIESAVQAIPVTSQTSEKSTVPTTPSLQEPVTVSGPRLFSEVARQPPPVPEVYRTTTPTVYLMECDTHYYLSTDSDVLVGGGDTPIFSKTDRILTYHEAADIIQQNLPDSVTYEPPYRPAAGSVYLCDDSGDTHKRDDWRADGYTWRNMGKRQYQVEGKLFERSFFKISNQGVVSDKFQKHAFRFVENDYNGRTVLVYFGDNEAYKALPHGNRKRNVRQHKRAKPSLLNEMNSRCKDEEPKILHDKMISECSPQTKLKGVGVPRNPKQVRNAQLKLRKNAKISHDSLYALHLLVDQLDNYILSIKTTPDLEVIVGNEDTFDEINRLLQLKDINVAFYYDTTFNLGDFYVSVLVCQHPMFKEKPTIPIAFMLHERKFQRCHEQFIDVLKMKIPKLNEKEICVVSDRETGIMNAFKERLDNCQLLICWNHIFSDVKFWVGKHGGGNDDRKVYDMNVRELLHCKTRELFDERYNEMKLIWSEAFVSYFEDNLYDTIVNHSGRWILESKDLYNPYSGITNNAVESMNAKLKRLLEHEEKEIDEIVLYFYYLQGNDLSELIRAFCGESELTLSDNFRFAARDPDTIVLPKNVCHPDKMIQLVKGDIAVLIDENKENFNENKIINSGVSSNENCKGESTEKSNSKSSSSQRSLAIKTISDNGIILVPEMGAFMVKSAKDKKYSVTLFPKETCSCLANTRCYHIISAMLAIGMSIPEDKKKVFNLSQLRKNCRPKHMKKCGTKKGRKGDNDGDTTILPAPDSAIKTVQSEEFDTPTINNTGINSKTNQKAKKTLLFNNSTPRSILKQNSDAQKTPVSTEKKRKLTFDDRENKKFAKLGNCSTILEDENFIDLELQREDNSYETKHEVIEIWNMDLRLTFKDRDDLINNKKLNSNHMEAVNIMLREKVGNSIGGLQLTEQVPKFDDTENRWKTKLPMESTVSPSCQIHHTHNDHWVVSIFHDNKIYLLDSLGNERPSERIITNGLKIQLSLIYGKDKKSITIQVPSVMKQNNSVDCGLFAIAFATSYCLRKKLCFDLIVDSTKLRSHLLNCFEKKEISEFPLTNKTISMRRQRHSTEINIEHFCLCNLPECLDNMVQCSKCEEWFHIFCINAPADIATADKDFTCGLC